MNFLKKPYLVSFAGNPMRYLLTAQNTGGLGEAPVFSVVEIAITDIDTTEDHSITVEMLDAERVFALKANPTDTGHLPAATEGMTPEEWAQAILDYLMGDVQIMDNYDPSIDQAVITLTAKTASASFDWTSGGGNITGITLSTTTGGNAGTTGTVQGVMMKVMKNGTTKIGEDYKPLDADGNVAFNIEEYVYAEIMQAAFPRFNLSAPLANYHIFYDYFLKYRAVFCDKIDGVFSARTYIEPTYPYTYALPGGLNRDDLVYNNDHAIDWFAQAATKKKFLTWAPPSRLTDKAETHSLFFAFQAPAYTHFKMKAMLYDDANEVGTTIDVTNQVGVGQFTVVEFMAGYTQLNLGSYLNGNVNRWVMYLVDQTGATISDLREFVIDPVYHENTRYFRFRNSWGTFDSLRCTGDFETTPENEREKVVFISDDVENSYNAPGSHTADSENQNFKANTGWVGRDELNYLRDFMISRDIFELDGTRILKCLLTSKKTSLFKDRNYNYNLEFEYERAHNDFFFQISE